MRRNAGNWLELADRVYQFRRDQLTDAQLGKLLTTSGEVRLRLKEKADASKLKLAVHFLTGRTVTAEPRLYLWGELIDPEHHRRDHFEPLREVRGRLEPDIHTF